MPVYAQCPSRCACWRIGLTVMRGGQYPSQTTRHSIDFQLLLAGFDRLEAALDEMAALRNLTKP